MSSVCGQCEHEDCDDIHDESAADNTPRQKQANQLVTAEILWSQNQMEKFINDETLHMSKLNTNVNHTGKLKLCCIDKHGKHSK